MKIPAIRAKIGNWTYYITTLTFQQVSDNISKVDDHLHKSQSLKELIQRSISNNYLSIKEYIIKQPELFFNALVLAVYDDYPNWTEIEVRYDNEETYQLGLLDFPANHKIFPLDGQHRVEGIKAAIIEDKEMGKQQIAAIFVGHKNDETGMQKSRRLFSTLNRYAKPVTMDDIIALDEDDSIAITTRELLETFDLFTSNRVTKNKNKAIHDSDKVSFTSIITLYDCNYELLKLFRRQRKQESPLPERDNKTLKEYLKFRPDESELTLYHDFCKSFWTTFLEKSDIIKEFLLSKQAFPATPYRNSNNGGNLLFRPVGLFPTIQAAIEIKKRTNKSWLLIFEGINTLNLNINSAPWLQVVWNPYENIMIMNNQGMTKLFLIYLFDPTLLRDFELQALKLKYAAAIGYTEAIDGVLDTIAN